MENFIKTIKEKKSEKYFKQQEWFTLFWLK
jgi:hypothetical protein